MGNETLLTLTADIVSAHVSNNSIAGGDVASLVERVYGSLAALGQPNEESPAEKVPVVSVRGSVKPDYLVCMECGAKQKMLKRHLMTAHGMTLNSTARTTACSGTPRSRPAASWSETM